MLQATQRPVDGHLVGVIASTIDQGGHAFLGVLPDGTAEPPEQFILATGETHLLADGWQVRLISVTQRPSGRGKATVEIELSAPPAD
jgi:hypothetical protein